MITKKLKINKFGNSHELKLVIEDLSESIADDDIVIEVHFSGVNFADIVMRLGQYQDAPPLPFVPGYEVSGIVSKIGKAVTKFRVGDKVITGTRFGGYSNYIIQKEFAIAHLPSHLSLAQGAALPVNFFTASIALNEFGRIRKDDHVLIDCATGGVGVICLQILKEMGAQYTGLTSSPHKKKFLESYGAKALTWDEYKMDNTQFDFILNSSGGSILKNHYKNLKKSGKLICIGLQNSIENGKSSKLKYFKNILSSPIYPILKLTIDSKMVGGFNALKYFEDDKEVMKWTTKMEKTNLVPYVGEVVSYKEAWRAHQILELKQTTGKVLISWID
jgi:NADPH:quinone reductase-like Zn-dependent oxidoreductase